MCSPYSCQTVYQTFLKFTFRERGREGEREGGKHHCMVASHALLLRTQPETQACALTGNRTTNPLVRRPTLNPLSYTIQGSISNFLIFANLIVDRGFSEYIFKYYIEVFIISFNDLKCLHD